MRKALRRMNVTALLHIICKHNDVVTTVCRCDLQRRRRAASSFRFSSVVDRWAPRSSGISAVITRLRTAVHWNSNCHHCNDSELYHGHQPCIFSCYLSLLFISVLEICPTLFLRSFTAGGRISCSLLLSPCA